MNRRLLLGALLLNAIIAGCGKVEMKYALSEVAKKELADKPADQEQLATLLDEVFGTPEGPRVSKAISAAVDAKVIRSSEEKLASVGAVKYRQWCMHCHGLSGDGAGPTAGPAERPFLNPRPRDYRLGRFKFTSTVGVPTNAKPTRADLLRTLQNGIPGTSMPSFALYDQDHLDAVLDYVILLSIRGETERGIVLAGEKITKSAVEQEAGDRAESWANVDSRVVNPTTKLPPADAESLAEGRKLYLAKGDCFKCHGPKALGNGWELDKTADPAKQKDDWGFQAKPADLTLGVFRGGSRPIDLFRRIQHGVKGTPMAAQAINLKEDEIWHLVNYVRAIAYRDVDAESPDASHGSEANN